MNFMSYHFIAVVFSSFSSWCLANTNYHPYTSVQLFEWSWKDVANECETFLGPKGFAAVQISPPSDHITGSPWWTRYQPVTYTLVSRSGNENDFKDMIKRCAAVNVSIIADAVINHMAAGSGVSVAGNKYGNRQYPYYSPNDFHHDANNVNTNCQVTNYYDKYNVQYCDLSGLPDLCTACTYVQTQIANYLNYMYTLGVKGLRIDAAKHQDATELQTILQKLPPNMYIGMEVIGGAGEAVQPSMYYSLGQVSEFNYADYLDDNIVATNKMVYLQSFGESWGLMPDEYAVVFLDNHDTQRNGRAQLTYKNGALYTFANIFMLSWPYGTTKLMSSYYFTDTDQGPPSVGVNNGANCNNNKDWVCEHRQGPISNMVRWKYVAGVNGVNNWFNGNTNQIAFSRGNTAFIALNRENSAKWTISSIYTGLPAGKYCNIIGDVNADKPGSSSCIYNTVDSTGHATNVVVPPLSAVAFHIQAKI